MQSSRFVIAGLAPARSEWFRTVGQWANEASLPIEFIKCVSAEELRARLSGGRPFSAVLIDARHAGLDRDLIDAATTSGVTTIVIADNRIERDWKGLGAAATLTETFDRADLLRTLEAVAADIRNADAAPTPITDAPSGWRGRLTVVTGPGGTGASTLAQVVAAHHGADPRFSGRVLLADLALDAQQALLHDAGDVVPSVLELVEAHRAGVPGSAELRDLTYAVPTRGYQLLLGLHHHHDWTALRARSVESAIDGLLRAFQQVVADIDDDVEGESLTGSADVEDRNVMARSAVDRAGCLVAVGTPGVKGAHSLVNTITRIIDNGFPADRILPVFNFAPRRVTERSELTGLLATLLGNENTEPIAPPIFVRPHRRLEELVHAGSRFPRRFASELGPAIDTIIERAEDRSATVEPQRITPGSLGSWPDEEAEAS